LAKALETWKERGLNEGYGPRESVTTSSPWMTRKAAGKHLLHMGPKQLFGERVAGKPPNKAYRKARSSGRNSKPTREGKKISSGGASGHGGSKELSGKKRQKRERSVTAIVCRGPTLCVGI